jgi:hypothetical protein
MRAANLRPEVGDDLDLRAPPVGGWPKKKRREGCVGPAEEEELGWPAARVREADGPSCLAGCGKRKGESWAGWRKKEEGQREKVFF